MYGDLQSSHCKKIASSENNRCDLRISTPPRRPAGERSGASPTRPRDTRHGYLSTSAPATRPGVIRAASYGSMLAGLSGLRAVDGPDRVVGSGFSGFGGV